MPLCFRINAKYTVIGFGAQSNLLEYIKERVLNISWLNVLESNLTVQTVRWSTKTPRQEYDSWREIHRDKMSWQRSPERKMRLLRSLDWEESELVEVPREKWVGGDPYRGKWDGSNPQRGKRTGGNPYKGKWASGYPYRRNQLVEIPSEEL